MNSELPLTCDMGAFTPSQREAHIQNTTELIQAVQSVQEIGNGYEFRFPSETDFISKIAEFISNERLCCPFLNFTLNIFSNNEQVSLLLTGPIGTQEFLHAEFDGVFQ
jgi:hypothetical protein